MSRFLTNPLFRIPLLIVLLLACFGVSGLVGLLSAQMIVEQHLKGLRQLFVEKQIVATTSTIPTVKVVSLESRPPGPPSFTLFTSRRSSPVLDVMKKSALEKYGDDVFTSSDKAFASAIALTTDGWMVMPDTAFKESRVADLVVLYQGRTYSLQKAVRDTTIGAVFLKIMVQDLSVTAFVKSTDVEQGMPVWIEPRSQHVSPQVILDTHVSASSSDPFSSERSVRRFLVSSSGQGMFAGGAVWDESGRLVGILESRVADGWIVLPASNLSSALSAVLSGQEIQHALLGVHAFDLSEIVFGETSSTIPKRGAWIHADRRGMLGVGKQSPAIQVLREGDVIERIERDILDGTADLGERLLDYRPGTTVNVFGKRQGKDFHFMVTLGTFIASEILK